MDLGCYPVMVAQTLFGEYPEKIEATCIWTDTGEMCFFLQIDFDCMFYQLLCVQHSCSSTQSWGSVLPSIAETRDQNSRGCPLLYSKRTLGFFVCIGDRNPIHPQPLGSCGPLPRERYMKYALSQNPGTLGLADECSTTELTFLLQNYKYQYHD